jgi:kynurenine formamidase
MFLDIADFPVVRMQAGPGKPEWESQFAALLSRAQRFVLLSVESPDTERDKSQNDRKQHALWLKRNRPALAQWCAGAVIVQPSLAAATASRVMAPALAKAFGFPVRIVGSESDVDTEVTKLLSQ